MQTNKKRNIKNYTLLAIFIIVIALSSAITVVWMILSRPNVFTRLAELEKQVVQISEKYSTILSEKENLTKKTDELSKEIEGAIKENERLSKELDDANKTISELQEKLYTEKPIVYFTFDDGPSKTTETVLDILGEFNVKATFFVIGPETEFKKKMIKRIHDEGHLIAIHSYTHQYKTIYASDTAFFKDFDRIETFVKETVGIQPSVFRFPGGSNTGYLKREVFDKIAPALANRGYNYIDWNVDSGDAKVNYPDSDNVSKSILSQCKYRLNQNKNKSCVVLMHDAAAKGAYIGKTLREIIPKLKEMGYLFEVLNEYAPASQFRKYTFL